MSDRKDHSIHVPDRTHIHKLNAVEPLCLCSVRLRIGDHGRDPVFLQFVNDVNDLCISGIRAVFLKGEA